MNNDPRTRPTTKRNVLGACEFYIGAPPKASIGEAARCERSDCGRTWEDHYPKGGFRKPAYEPGARRY